jgi:hypothetical protein
MTLDDLVRQATGNVVERVAPTAAARLVDLKATRARRSRVGAAAVCAVLVLAVAVGLRPGPDGKASLEPAGQVHNGVLVLLKGQGPLLQRPQGSLRAVPQDVMAFSPLAFIKGGNELVYRNQDGQFIAFDVRSGGRRVLHSCPKEGWCEFAVSPDGLRTAAGTAGGIKVTDTRTGNSFTLDTGAAFFLQWSQDGRDLLFSDSGQDLSRVRVQAGARATTVVVLQDGHQPLEPRWSPDGRQVAYFDYEQDEPGSAFGTYVAMLAAAAGTGDPRQLVVAAHGCCGGLPPPALVWTPDGTHLLVGSLIDTEQVPVHAFTPDGQETSAPAAISELVGVAAWQPVPETKGRP